MAATSTHQARNNNPTENRDTLFIGLYLRNIGANLFSFAAIVLLNVFTPLDFFKLRIDFFFFQGGWVFFLVFFFIASLLVLSTQYAVQRPISRHAAALKQNREIDTALQEKARVRLLNLPFIIALIDLSMFIIVPLTVMATLEFFRDIPLKMFLFIFFRTFLLGLIAAWLSFFLIEDYARTRLVPLLFPRGRLTAVSGTITRAATSVATRIGSFPERKAFNARCLAPCDLSP